MQLTEWARYNGAAIVAFHETTGTRDDRPRLASSERGRGTPGPTAPERRRTTRCGAVTPDRDRPGRAADGASPSRVPRQAAQDPVEEASDRNQKKKSVPLSTFVATVVHSPAVVSV